MTTFYRGGFQELWLTLSSDEALGLLDTGYLQDWSGQDGSVSLLHLHTGQRFPVPMAPAPPDSAANFRGWVALEGLPSGSYAIQGRVRDLVGNITILGAFHAPDGIERVLSLGFILADGARAMPVVHLGPALLQGGVRLPSAFPAALNLQGERVCSKALSVSGFPSRLGVTLPAPMR